LAEALRGWSKVRKPAGWEPLQAKVAAASSSALRTRARDLSALFGDGRALDEVKRVALDNKTELAFRKAAVQTLIEQRPPDLRQICEQLLKVRFLNSVAVRGLALYDDPALGQSLAQSYRQFHPSERPPVMETLVSRPSFAKPMLDEMAEGRIPRADLSAFQARQIKSFNQPEVTKRLETVWGVLHDSPAEKQQTIAKWKTKLTPDVLGGADKHAGRLVFEKTCAACHTLYGRGGQVGPDLTGSGRDNLDYLLDNIVDPSAVVNADYHMSVVELKDGRQLNGLISAKTDRTLTLKTVNETLSLERSEIESVLMPEGLLDTLNEAQVRNLIAYLMSRAQVP
jgi:putative heme-binding domain-containing protein